MSLKHKIQKSSILVALLGCCFFAYNRYWQSKAYQDIVPNSATRVLRFSTTTLAKELAFSVLKNPRTYYQKYKDTSMAKSAKKTSLFKAFGLPASVFAFTDKADTTALYIPLKIKNKQEAILFVKKRLGDFKMIDKEQYTLATNGGRWSFAYNTTKIVLRYSYLKNVSTAVFQDYFTVASGFLDRASTVFQNLQKPNILLQAYGLDGDSISVKAKDNALIAVGFFSTKTNLVKDTTYTITTTPLKNPMIKGHVIPKALPKEIRQKTHFILGDNRALLHDNFVFAAKGCTKVFQKKISYSYDANFNKVPTTTFTPDTIANMVVMVKDTSLINLNATYDRYFTWHAKKITPSYTQYTTDSGFKSMSIGYKKTPYFFHFNIRPEKFSCMPYLSSLQNIAYLEVYLQHLNQQTKAKLYILQKDPKIHPLLCFF